jgi:hypothetical protein
MEWVSDLGGLTSVFPLCFHKRFFILLIANGLQAVLDEASKPCKPCLESETQTLIVAALTELLFKEYQVGDSKTVKYFLACISHGWSGLESFAETLGG